MKKLNKHQVRRIREVYWSENKTYGDLAEKYDVTTYCIKHVVNGSTWEHVGGPTGVDPDKGYTTSTKKITDQQREEIKRRRENGETLESIAYDYPIGPSQVCNITSGQRESNLTSGLDFNRSITLPLTEYDFVSEMPV